MNLKDIDNISMEMNGVITVKTIQDLERMEVQTKEIKEMINKEIKDLKVRQRDE